MLNCIRSVFKLWNLIKYFNNSECLSLSLDRVLIAFKMPFESFITEIANQKVANARDENEPK